MSITLKTGQSSPGKLRQYIYIDPSIELPSDTVVLAVSEKEIVLDFNSKEGKVRRIRKPNKYLVQVDDKETLQHLGYVGEATDYNCEDGRITIRTDGLTKASLPANDIKTPEKKNKVSKRISKEKVVELKEQNARFLHQNIRQVKHLHELDLLHPEEEIIAWGRRQKLDEHIINNFLTIRRGMLKGSGNWQLREMATALALGHVHGSADVNGPDAYGLDGQPYEYKINWVSSDNPETGLEGSGSFNDYPTEERLNNLLNSDIRLVVACWIDHRLFLAAEVPITWKPLAERLRDDFNKRKDANRTCLGFNYSHWITCPNLVWHVRPTLRDIFDEQKNLSRSFLYALLDVLENKIC